MVRALLDGSKTQTRRVVKGYPLDWLEAHNFTPEFVALPSNKLCPYGFAGDELWVKETHWRDDEDGAILFAANPDDFAVVQQNKLETGSPRYNWKPSIFMPRSASRITLEITGTRVERLQSISESDAIAEGWLVHRPSDPRGYTSPCQWYAELWQEINGPDSCGANPWVWVVEFNVKGAK